MKKIISIILNTIIMLFISISVFAANGDVVGSIYSTDIKTCINGVWVDSYNIGGKTVVVVEDITNQFTYSNALRTLIIKDLNPEYIVSGEKSYNQKPGTPIGKIYETDIKTIFRGKELTSYSLNGKMAIEIEELGRDNTFSDIGVGTDSGQPSEYNSTSARNSQFEYKLITDDEKQLPYSGQCNMYKQLDFL